MLLSLIAEHLLYSNRFHDHYYFECVQSILFEEKGSTMYTHKNKKRKCFRQNEEMALQTLLVQQDIFFYTFLGGLVHFSVTTMTQVIIAY